MKFELLPSTFDENGKASSRQHLPCFVVDNCVAFDAGSLAMGCNDLQRANIRDVVLTHAHLDHVAGLPLFIDDLYSTLVEPVTVHAAPEVIEVLEQHIFNWSVYPKFSELKNGKGPVMIYKPFAVGTEFSVKHLRIMPLAVNHRVPTAGFIISNGSSAVAMSGDTWKMDGFWPDVNKQEALSALLIECAFPNELEDLAEISHHLTPRSLAIEIEKFMKPDCPIHIINIKPAYRDAVIGQLRALGSDRIKVFEVGTVYDL
ncbi:MAG: MBL fold metallo-hydrolase [Candidatus Binatia bacterium]